MYHFWGSLIRAPPNWYISQDSSLPRISLTGSPQESTMATEQGLREVTMEDIVLFWESIHMAPRGHAGCETKYIASEHKVTRKTWATGPSGETHNSEDELSIPETISSEEELHQYVQDHCMGWLGRSPIIATKVEHRGIYAPPSKRSPLPPPRQEAACPPMSQSKENQEVSSIWANPGDLL